MPLQRHLSPVLAALLAIGPITPAVGGEIREVQIVVDSANVRAEPSLEGRVLQRAARGTVLRVVDEVKDWFLVTAPGMEPGYVNKTVVRRLTARTAAASTPASDTAPTAAPPQVAPPAVAATAPTISHVPLKCMAADANPLVLADVTAQAQVHKARVYFKAHQFPDWYYVDMKVPDQPHYQALLPQPLPETEQVDYYIHALDTALETSRTNQFEPQVRKSGCKSDERAAAARVDPKEATELVIGGTKERQPPIPPGFSKKGIFAFVAVTGAIITGAALMAATASTAAMATAATAAATTATTTAATTAAGATTAGAAAAGAGTAGTGAAGTAAATGGAAAAGGGGLSGGAIAGIAAGGVLVAGGIGFGVYKATQTVDDLTCVSASDIAAQSGGSIVAVGNDTICTTYQSCGRRSFRACAADYCSNSSCSIYYQFSDGARVNCTANCNNGDYSGIYSCADTASRYCQ